MHCLHALRAGCGRIVALGALLWITGAQAKIVALDIDLPLDQVAPDRAAMMKIGDHHRARIFYDDSTIDPRTHVVRVIHMQHMVGQWIPAALGDPSMPMTDAWLDLSKQPYRYHYHSAVVDMGEAVIVDFDAKEQRMSIRKQSDRSVIVSAPMHIDPTPVAGVGLAVTHAPDVVMLDVKVHLDQVSADPQKAVGMHVGDTDRVRILYDANAVDARSKRVPLLNFQHFIGGQYLPAAPDATMMPTNDAWLDVGSTPYRLHFKAAVVHGRAIVVEVDENSRRLTIREQGENGAVLLAGPYEIDTTPQRGADANRAAGIGG